MLQPSNYLCPPICISENSANNFIRKKDNKSISTTLIEVVYDHTNDIVIDDCETGNFNNHDIGNVNEHSDASKVKKQQSYEVVNNELFIPSTSYGERHRKYARNDNHLINNQLNLLTFPFKLKNEQIDRGYIILINLSLTQKCKKYLIKEMHVHDFMQRSLTCINNYDRDHIVVDQPQCNKTNDNYNKDNYFKYSLVVPVKANLKNNSNYHLHVAFDFDSNKKPEYTYNIGHVRGEIFKTFSHAKSIFKEIDCIQLRAYVEKSLIEISEVFEQCTYYWTYSQATGGVHLQILGVKTTYESLKQIWDTLNNKIHNLLYLYNLHLDTAMTTFFIPGYHRLGSFENIYKNFPYDNVKKTFNEINETATTEKQILNGIFPICIPSQCSCVFWSFNNQSDYKIHKKQIYDIGAKDKHIYNADILEHNDSDVICLKDNKNVNELNYDEENSPQTSRIFSIPQSLKCTTYTGYSNFSGSNQNSGNERYESIQIEANTSRPRRRSQINWQPNNTNDVGIKQHSGNKLILFSPVRNRQIFITAYEQNCYSLIHLLGIYTGNQTWAVRILEINLINYLNNLAYIIKHKSSIENNSTNQNYTSTIFRDRRSVSRHGSHSDRTNNSIFNDDTRQSSKYSSSFKSCSLYDEDDFCFLLTIFLILLEQEVPHLKNTPSNSENIDKQLKEYSYRLNDRKNTNASKIIAGNIDCTTFAELEKFTNDEFSIINGENELDTLKYLCKLSKVTLFDFAKCYLSQVDYEIANNIATIETYFKTQLQKYLYVYNEMISVRLHQKLSLVGNGILHLLMWRETQMQPLFIETINNKTGECVSLVDTFMKFIMDEEFDCEIYSEYEVRSNKYKQNYNTTRVQENNFNNDDNISCTDSAIDFVTNNDMRHPRIQHLSTNISPLTGVSGIESRRSTNSEYTVNMKHIQDELTSNSKKLLKFKNTFCVQNEKLGKSSPFYMNLETAAIDHCITYLLFIAFPFNGKTYWNAAENKYWEPIKIGTYTSHIVKVHINAICDNLSKCKLINNLEFEYIANTMYKEYINEYAFNDNETNCDDDYNVNSSETNHIVDIAKVKSVQQLLMKKSQENREKYFQKKIGIIKKCLHSLPTLNHLALRIEQLCASFNSEDKSLPPTFLVTKHNEVVNIKYAIRVPNFFFLDFPNNMKTNISLLRMYEVKSEHKQIAKLVNKIFDKVNNMISKKINELLKSQQNKSATTLNTSVNQTSTSNLFTQSKSAIITTSKKMNNEYCSVKNIDQITRTTTFIDILYSKNFGMNDIETVLGFAAKSTTLEQQFQFDSIQKRTLHECDANRFARGLWSLLEIFQTPQRLLHFICIMCDIIFRGMRKKVIIFFSENPNMGKSTLCKIMARLLGDFAEKLAFSVISKKAEHESKNPGIVRASNKIIAMFDEVPKSLNKISAVDSLLSSNYDSETTLTINSRSNPANVLNLLKTSLTGNHTSKLGNNFVISAYLLRYLTGNIDNVYGHRNLYENTKKLNFNLSVALFVNHPPRIDNVDVAEFKRMFAIELTKDFSGTTKCEDLDKKIDDTTVVLEILCLTHYYSEQCGETLVQQDELENDSVTQNNDENLFNERKTVIGHHVDCGKSNNDTNKSENLINTVLPQSGPDFGIISLYYDPIFLVAQRFYIEHCGLFPTRKNRHTQNNEQNMLNLNNASLMPSETLLAVFNTFLEANSNNYLINEYSKEDHMKHFKNFYYLEQIFGYRPI